ATYDADKGDFDEAKAEFKRARELAPNNADILLFHGAYLPQLGDPPKAFETVERAVRLNPYFPFWYDRGLRSAYYFAGKFDKAYAAAQRIGCGNPNDCGWLAVTLAQIGRIGDAREVARMLPEDWSAEARMSEFGKFTRDTEPRLFAEG